MNIFRRIINNSDSSDDCIYQLVCDGGVYKWHYRFFTNQIDIQQYYAPILYKTTSAYNRLSGVLEFSQEDLSENCLSHNQ